MKKIGLLLFAGFYFFLAPACLCAQSDDPSDVFLKAYMTSQQGEKLEHDNQFQAALAKFRFAGSLLEELRKAHSDWQPAIVDYRSRKIGENILRVQNKLSSQKDLAVTSKPPPASSATPVLPTTAGPAEPSVDLGPAQTGEARIPVPQSEPRAPVANDSAIQDATKKLREKVDQLQSELQKSRSQYTTVEKEKESLNRRLKETDSKLEKAQSDLEKTKGAGKEARSRLSQAEAAQDRVQILVAENTELKVKLADAERSVRDIGADKPKKEQEIAEVKRQVEQLRQQLAARQKQNKDFEVTVSDLRSQLDEASGALAKAKLTGANAEATARLTKENKMLRRIVVRERQEEARRDQAKKLMLAEFEKLQIKSETLNQQIELLAQPVTKLSADELALLGQPVVTISESNPAALQASFSVAKQVPVSVNNPNAKQPSGDDATSSGNPSVQTMAKPGVPEDLAALARDAKENFDRGKYHAAEKQYQDILAKSPNNLYSLSNLGVVYFRTGKLKEAELMLKKAVTIAPKDEFSHTTLGIVYYRQSKFDDAVTELTKALGINPRSATAHNYLGITASQKGWQEAAEKEMLDAIAANPGYADAHFNLAVIYATGKPPAKELAKQHYAKATSLGAEADPSLERLLR
ncbi:MAG: tetratricopeptide repeat protein [Verrucomicrobiota bacterium]